MAHTPEAAAEQLACHCLIAHTIHMALGFMYLRYDKVGEAFLMDGCPPGSLSEYMRIQMSGILVPSSMRRNGRHVKISG